MRSALLRALEQYAFAIHKPPPAAVFAQIERRRAEEAQRIAGDRPAKQPWWADKPN